MIKSRSFFRFFSTELPRKDDTLRKFIFPKNNTSIDQLNDHNTSDVVIHGWVDQKPKKMSSNLVFSRLRDSNGDTIQLVDRSGQNLIRQLKPESAVAIKGNLETRDIPGGGKALDLLVTDVNVLNQAGITGSHLSSSETIPAEYRFMQLRQKNMQRNLQTRAHIMRTARGSLDKQGFTEIETPLLFKSTPEGAREFLVPTRRAKYMYALPQSPQQYKQLLMASGISRYYQMAKCFRDEDLRADRQPEFTQLDLEMSFSSGSEVKSVLETVISDIWKACNKQLWTLGESMDLVPYETGKFTSLSYSTAISKFGIDKPDLRYNLEIQRLPGCISTENELFPVLEALIIRNSEIDQLDLNYSSDTNLYSARLPVFHQVSSDYSIETLRSWIDSLATCSSIEEIFNILALKPGDTIAFGSRQELSYENPTPLGRLRQLIIEKYPEKHLKTSIASRDLFVASWIENFPLFVPKEDNASANNRYPTYKTELSSNHHPFTMVNLDDYYLLETNPLATRGQHYDLVINGVEIGGGSTRIHDVQLQTFIFERILGISNYMQLFGHLLRAFDTGCPPHAGFAIGFDRMTAMLCGTSSIRDVIAFPKSITGSDATIGSPSKPTRKQLEPYHIGWK